MRPGGQPNMQQIMKQAQKMQQQVAEAQAELAAAELTGTAGGGLVSVVVTGLSCVADEMWRTQTAWPGERVPAADTNVSPQSIEYVPPLTETATGKHHEIAYRKLANERLVGGGQFLGRRRLVHHEKELVAATAKNAAAYDFSQAKLWSGEIDQNGQGLVQLLAHLAHAVEGNLLRGGLAVRHVEAKDVGAGSHQVSEYLDVATRGADGGDDFRPRPGAVAVE